MERRLKFERRVSASYIMIANAVQLLCEYCHNRYRRVIQVSDFDEAKGALKSTFLSHLWNILSLVIAYDVQVITALQDDFDLEIPINKVACGNGISIPSRFGSS